MMKILFALLVLQAMPTFSYTQRLAAIINQKEVTRIESILSADDMEGRKAFTPGNTKAANFISNEFKKMGLKTFNGSKGYLQSFTMVKAKPVSISASFGGNAVDQKNIFVLTCLPELDITNRSGFKIITIAADGNFIDTAMKYSMLPENTIIFADQSFSKYVRQLSRVSQNLFKSDKSVVFVFGNYDTTSYEIKATTEITNQQAANVVGVLPGKSKSKQFVVYSGHYDHLGIKEGAEGDSIFNGANDDASGVAAIIAMAEYYKKTHNNERTLIFAAFTAEEIGGFGSQYFSRQLDPDKVSAMFNIEMIGTESKWGKNSAYITGFEKSNLGVILQQNLKGSQFAFYADPYPTEHLFYRSDNATLAKLGVPAHTISTSKMDNEPNYHKVSDEIKTLDIANMAAVIQSVVVSAKSIVSGTDTPTRVAADQ